jgi:uncharacterized membrane protein
VHRHIEISAPPQATDGLLAELRALPGVITLSVRRGDSVTPPGDIITVTALNPEADAVLRAAERAGRSGAVAVATGTVDSLIAPAARDAVRADEDEALWEEAETALRRHTRPNLNLFMAAAGGGVAVATALAASSPVTEATALVAAAIIAPVFEPLARIGLGVVNRHRRMMTGALGALVMTYVVVALAALVTMLVLRLAGDGAVSDFLRSSTAIEVQHPPLDNLLLSAAGAVTGAIMVAAGRYTVLAGPIIALQLIPALGVIGIGIELGDGGVALRGLGRLGIDAGFVLVACLLVFTYKHRAVHDRRPAST